MYLNIHISPEVLSVASFFWQAEWGQKTCTETWLAGNDETDLKVLLIRLKRGIGREPGGLDENKYMIHRHPCMQGGRSSAVQPTPWSSTFSSSLSDTENQISKENDRGTERWWHFPNKETHTRI